MTYYTHRAFAVAFAIGGSVALTELGMSDVHPLIAAPVLLMAAKSGALFPDVDHEWDNVKDKTLPNRAVNMLIHITGGRHRSWQTHSLDIWVAITLAALLFVPMAVTHMGVSTASVLSMLVYGHLLGWGSHLFADMLNHTGIRLFFWTKKVKLRFVPRIKYFTTGGKWEEQCCFVVGLVNGFLGLAYVVAYALPLILNFSDIIMSKN